MLKLLENEQLSSSKFADVIGVQRSSVSHILSGRNKPSFDFLQKTLRAFPALNADWLILGEGDMYEGTVSSFADGLFDQGIKPETENDAQSAVTGVRLGAEASSEPRNSDDIRVKGAPGSEISTSEHDIQAGQAKRITRVIMFYDDNSFRSYEPDA